MKWRITENRSGGSGLSRDGEKRKWVRFGNFKKKRDPINSVSHGIIQCERVQTSISFSLSSNWLFGFAIWGIKSIRVRMDNVEGDD